MLRCLKHFEFDVKKANGEKIRQWCKYNHVKDEIELGTLQDFAAGYHHDAQMREFMPKLMEILNRMKYVPVDTGLEEEVEANKKHNDKIVDEMQELMETSNIPYRFYDNIDSYIKALASTVSRVCAKLNNQAGESFSHMAAVKFGCMPDEIHSGHFANYIKEQLKPLEKNEENKD